MGRCNIEIRLPGFHFCLCALRDTILHGLLYTGICILVFFFSKEILPNQLWAWITTGTTASLLIAWYVVVTRKYLAKRKQPART